LGLAPDAVVVSSLFPTPKTVALIADLDNRLVEYEHIAVHMLT
jgi:hypothetical protein